MKGLLRGCLLVALASSLAGCTDAPGVEETANPPQADPAVPLAGAAAEARNVSGESRVRIVGVCDGEACTGVSQNWDGTFEARAGQRGEIRVEWTPTTAFSQRLRVLVAGEEAVGESPLTIPVNISKTGAHTVRLWPGQAGAGVDQAASWSGVLTSG